MQSSGTETKPQINPDAVRLMKQVHHLDMEAEGQQSKLLSDIPKVDVVITMGCNVQCPFLPCQWREDWGLDDPTGKPDEAFLETIRLIEEKVLDLKDRLQKLRFRRIWNMKQENNPGISFFQRYLTLWVAICMMLGVLIGKYLPGIPAFLNRFEYARVSIPMAILIWLMITP